MLTATKTIARTENNTALTAKTRTAATKRSMTRSGLALCALLFLGACDASSLFRPDFSFDDLDFGGDGFSGMPTTPAGAMPVAGAATYEGMIRGRINEGDYENGDASVAIEFGTGKATLTGSVEFSGAQGYDSVSFDEDLTIVDSAAGTTPGTSSDTIVAGQFYGGTGDYFAGTIAKRLNGVDRFTGGFATKR